MVRLGLLLAVLAACGRTTPAPGRDAAATAPPPPPERLAPDAAPAAAAPAPIDLAGLYDGAACLVVRSPDGTIQTSDPVRCGERLRPASTFKIVNALIGADLGLLDGPDAVMAYDQKRYPRQDGWGAGWDRPQPLREAMKISAVPAFRLLAIKIGAERMQAALDALGYGNRSIAGGLDLFWLSGDLAVSAGEQVELITGLVTSRLPVTPRAQEIVREAMPREAAPDGAVLHFKTGTAPLDDGPWVGWLVGWIDRGGQATPYACWIKHPPDDFAVIRATRLRVCRGALERLGLFPAPASAP